MKKQTSKLVIFDAFGVCLKGGYPQTCQALAHRFGRSWKDLYEIFYVKYFNQAATKKITQQEAWERAVKEAALPTTVSEVKKIHFALVKPEREMLAFAQKLSRSGYLSVLLSKNTRSQFSTIKVQHPILEETFGKHMINTWEYDLPKANRKTLLFLCKRYNTVSEAIVYIDDQKKNLNVAQKLGSRVILCQNTNQGIRDINRALQITKFQEGIT